MVRPPSSRFGNGLDRLELEVGDRHSLGVQFRSPGRFRSAAEFRRHIQAIDPDFSCDDEVDPGGPLAGPLEHGGHTFANRFATHPMEGWDGTRDGLPTEHTLRRWRNFGRSGAALIWGGEAFAVEPAGRANPNQLCRHPNADAEGGLVRLLETLREGCRERGGDPDDLHVGLQLTHSGRFARPEGEPAPGIVHHHPLLEAKYGLAPAHPLLTDGELEKIGEDFVRTAEMAERAGFRFVDVKCCHGYLLHETLAARTRPGSYGGSLENRTRLLRRILSGIRAACPGLEIGVRMSVGDTLPWVRGADDTGEPMRTDRGRPYEHGFGVDPSEPMSFDLREPLEVLRMLRSEGIRLINVTLGSPYYNPHLQRPAAYPPSDGYLPPDDPLLMVWRHLQATRRVKAEFPDLVVVGTGYTYLQEFLPHVAQREVREGHVDFIGLGRMLLAYPELPADVLAGRELQHKRLCRTFSDCTTAPRNGLISGCYPLDPVYKALPEAAVVRKLKKEIPK